jgi:DNA-binding response OmpR family regulator
MSLSLDAEEPMIRVLLLTNDPTTSSICRDCLCATQYQVATTSTGREGLEFGGRFQPDLAFISLDLPDMYGIDVVRAFRTISPATACLVVAAQTAWPATVEAMRSGACDWLEKPVSEADVSTAIHRILHHRVSDGSIANLPPSEPHAHARLAERAVRFITSPIDAPTLHEFARAVGISVGGLRNWCRTAGLRARPYVHLARGLRVVYRRQLHPSESLENLLEIVDRRTLLKFVSANGGCRGIMPATVDELLTVQRLVTPAAAQAIRLALSRALPPLDVASELSGSFVHGRAESRAVLQR